MVKFRNLICSLNSEAFQPWNAGLVCVSCTLKARFFNVFCDALQVAVFKVAKGTQFKKLKARMAVHFAIPAGALRCWEWARLPNGADRPHFLIGENPALTTNRQCAHASDPWLVQTSGVSVYHKLP